MLHSRLGRLTSAVSGSYGVAGVKAAMNAVGLKGGEPRSPLMSAPDEEIVKIVAAMQKEGFID